MATMTHLRSPIFVSLVFAFAACKGGEKDRFADSPKNGPYDKVVAENLPSLEKATGLTFKRFPTLRATTPDEVRSFAEKVITEEPTASALRGQEAVYKQLGLLPDTLDLTEFLLDVIKEQTVGLYDHRSKVLYMRMDQTEQVTNITIAHEMIHALQDQYLNLDSVLKHTEDNDRLGAVKAIIEGQATYEQVLATVGGKSNLAARLPGGWDRVRDMIREQQTSMPLLASSPMIIQETLLFPYLSGAEFAKRYKEKYPQKSLLQDLPTSTEQLMHSDAYFATPRDEPVRITLAAPRSGAKVYENNLGEFETRLFLYQHLRDHEAAIRGAAGWDGDRYMLVRTAQGDGIAWVSVWDSAVDGAEFADLMERLIRKRYGASLPRVDGDTKHYVGGGRSLVITSREIGGRPAVVYIDMPSGASTNILDVAAIRVQ